MAYCGDALGNKEVYEYESAAGARGRDVGRRLGRKIRLRRIKITSPMGLAGIGTITR